MFRPLFDYTQLLYKFLIISLFWYPVMLRSNGAHGNVDGMTIADLASKINCRASTMAPTKATASTAVIATATDGGNGTYNKVAHVYARIRKGEGELPGPRDITPFTRGRKLGPPRLGGQVPGPRWVAAMTTEIASATLRSCQRGRFDFCEIVMAGLPTGTFDDTSDFEAFINLVRSHPKDPFLNVTKDCYATLNPEACGLHYDVFSEDSTSVEFSISQARGQADLEITPPPHAKPSTLVPGGVFFPSYKIASLNIEAEVVDVLCCTRQLHGCRPAPDFVSVNILQNTSSAKKPTRKSRRRKVVKAIGTSIKRRGAWSRSTGHLRFYPLGVGLTDW